MSEPTVIVTDTPDAGDVAVIGLGLGAYNVEQTGIDDHKPLAVLVKDADGQDHRRHQRPLVARAAVPRSGLSAPSRCAAAGWAAGCWQRPRRRGGERGCKSAVLYTHQLPGTGVLQEVRLAGVRRDPVRSAGYQPHLHDQGTAMRGRFKGLVVGLVATVLAAPVLAQTQLEITTQAARDFAEADGRLNKVYRGLGGEAAQRACRQAARGPADLACSFGTRNALSKPAGNSGRQRSTGRPRRYCQTRFTEERIAHLEVQLKCTEASRPRAYRPAGGTCLARLPARDKPATNPPNPQFPECFDVARQGHGGAHRAARPSEGA